MLISLPSFKDILLTIYALQAEWKWPYPLNALKHVHFLLGWSHLRLSKVHTNSRFMMTFSRNLMTWQNPHKVINTTCTKGWITSISILAHLLITFAIRLDQDQDRQNVGPDLDPNYLTLWWYFWKNFSKKLIFKKSADDIKSMQNYPVGKELKLWYLPKCQWNVSALIFYSIVFQEIIKANKDSVEKQENGMITDQTNPWHHGVETDKQRYTPTHLSKFEKSWTLENQNLKLAYASIIIKNSKFNGQIPLEKLKLNQKSYYYLQNSAFWDWLSIESQPQKPEFRNNPENFL